MPSAYIAAVLADSPVCFFQLDEDTPWHNCRVGSGMVLRPTAQAVGTQAAALFPGSARGLKLNSVGEYQFSDPLRGVSTSAICIEAWVRRPVYGSGALFARGRDGFGNGWNVFFNVLADGSLSGAVVTTSSGTAANSAQSAAGVVPASGAVHAVMNFIPGTGLRLYANGVLVASANFTATSLRTSTFEAAIGGHAGAFHDAHVDDIAIYDKALSEARITAHYAAASDSHADEVATLNWSNLVSLSSRHKIAASADVPPFLIKGCAAPLVALDTEFGGQGRYPFVVEGLPTSQKARVSLLRARDRLVAREMWAAADGTGEFTGLDVNTQFIAVAQDPSGLMHPVGSAHFPILPESTT